MFTTRSVGLADDQLTGPILGRSAGLQTELGQFGWKSKVRKTQGPFDKKVSGLRLARQDSECAFSATPVSKNSPQASKTNAFLGVPGGGSKASNLAPRRLDLHNLTTLADLTSRTPSGAVPEAKLGRSWASSGALLAPRSPLRWVFFRSSSTSLAAQPDLIRSMQTSRIIQTSWISAVTNNTSID